MYLWAVDEVDLYYYACPQSREMLITMILQEQQLVNTNFHDKTFLFLSVCICKNIMMNAEAQINFSYRQ